MKTRVLLTTSIALMLGLASVASAQLRAGSPEEAEFTKIEAEKNSDARLALLLDFEKKYANINGKVLATVYLMAMDIYSEKDNKPKIAEYGDKAITKDPENVSALLRVSLNYAKERINLPKAEEYAEKAKTVLVTMRSQPTPTGQTEAQWKQWLDANQQSAVYYADYARSLQR
jgi:hypothetical protein